MKIAMAQLECRVGDIDANCAKVEAFTREAARQGCRMVIFPEMSDTGYEIPVIQKTAQPWPGPAYSRAAAAAAEHSIYVVCGLSERAGALIYNAIAVLSPSGELLCKYRKMHLFSPCPVEEHRCFTAGSESVTFTVADITFGLSICYDLRFPEFYRKLALNGAHALINCTAWPNFRPGHWNHLSRARAIENQAYFIGVDRAGTDGGMTFNGQSRIVEPFGEIAAHAHDHGEELVVGEIDLRKVTDFREKIPVLDSRRGDVYGDLERR